MLEREMFQTNVVEKIKTHILYSVTFSRKSYRLWDNVENKKIYITERCMSQMITCRMCCSCCVPKTTNTHSQYAILIACPPRHWLRERASLLCQYAHCLSFVHSHFIALSPSVLLVADTSYSYHPAIHDDTFVRRKQRRNRTTFTLQQVRKYYVTWRIVSGGQAVSLPRVFEIADTCEV